MICNAILNILFSHPRILIYTNATICEGLEVELQDVRLQGVVSNAPGTRTRDQRDPGNHGTCPWKPGHVPRKPWICPWKRWICPWQPGIFPMKNGIYHGFSPWNMDKMVVSPVIWCNLLFSLIIKPIIWIDRFGVIWWCWGMNQRIFWVICSFVGTSRPRNLKRRVIENQGWLIIIINY